MPDRELRESDVQYVSVAEVSEIIGCDVKTVRKYIRLGHFGEVVQLPGSIGFRIQRDKVDQFIAAHKVMATAREELGRRHA